MTSLKEELYKQIRVQQDKYTYFMLAVAASAIAYSIQKTENRFFEYSLVPLGFAILCWGFSFFYGCRYITYVTVVLLANFKMFVVAEGADDDVPNHDEAKSEAIQGLKRDIAYNNSKAIRYYRRQTNLVLAGVVFFIVWNVFEMYLRTLCQTA
jgi:hypothetical protein